MRRAARGCFVRACFVLAVCVLLGSRGSANQKVAAADPSASRLLYTNTAIPAGNTVTGTTAETMFASQYSAPASPPAGTVYTLTYAGVYSAPLVQGGTTTLRFYRGGVLLVSTPALVNLAGASRLSYSGRIQIKVMTPGDTGTAYVSGSILFSTSLTQGSPVDMSGAVVSGVNWNALGALRASQQSSVTGASNTLQSLIVESACAAATN